MRKIKFENSNYYHIYNRGVDKRNIFLDKKDFIRFLTGIREFNNTEPIGSFRDLKRRNKLKTTSEAKLLPISRGLASPLVEIISYCLNQNHFHLLLKQLTHKGVEKFLHKIGTSYTKYFNTKYKRSGSLFQGTFKAAEIKSEYQLIQLSCYIHGNPEIHKFSKVEKWIWSSYFDYLNKRNGTLCNKKIILKEFKNINEYKNLTKSLIKDFTKQKDEIKNIIME